MRGFLTYSGESHAIALARTAGGYAVAGAGLVTPTGDGWEIAGRHVCGKALFDGRELWVHVGGNNYRLAWHDAVEHHVLAEGGTGSDNARAPMPGVVVSVAVSPGQSVNVGDMLLIIESMKLETVIRASRSGVIGSVPVAAGQTFERDALLISFKVDDQ